jgi:hypothetical protein
MAPSTRKQISQPPEWWAAFTAQAERDGYTGVSEWLGAVGVANLDSDLAEGLPERQGRGKPPLPKD